MSTIDCPDSAPPGDASGAFAWDSSEYDVVANAQERWGREVIERNPWRGDEVVLDAGCGSGRLIPFLAAKIPLGRLVCVDRDGGMTEVTRRRVRELRLAIPVDVVLADLAALESAPLRPASFDVVFSNAALHWVPEKLRAFAGFSRLLQAGGRLTVQCGGAGNIQRIRAAIYRCLRELKVTATVDEQWFFQPVDETREQLKVCGFRDVRVWQTDALESFPDRAAFLRFCTAVILRPFQAQLSPEQWEGLLATFPEQAHALLGGWRVDYVRQNIEARK